MLVGTAAGRGRLYGTLTTVHVGQATERDYAMPITPHLGSSDHTRPNLTAEVMLLGSGFLTGAEMADHMVPGRWSWWLGGFVGLGWAQRLWDQYGTDE
jgi:hypothetical protein